MNQIKIGNFIAEVRKQQNMTQRELAEKIGVSDKTISKWETEKVCRSWGICNNCVRYYRSM